jgi:hypothetical protein
MKFLTVEEVHAKRITALENEVNDLRAELEEMRGRMLTQEALTFLFNDQIGRDPQDLCSLGKAWVRGTHRAMEISPDQL